MLENIDRGLRSRLTLAVAEASCVYRSQVLASRLSIARFAQQNCSRHPIEAGKAAESAFPVQASCAEIVCLPSTRERKEKQVQYHSKSGGSWRVVFEREHMIRTRHSLVVQAAC